MRNPLSLEAFADWCEKQPADEEYDVWQPSSCAVALYAQSLGFKRATDNGRIETHDGRVLPIDGFKFRMIARHPYTFGALAKRLRGVSS
jgi:hypothetical protein